MGNDLTTSYPETVRRLLRVLLETESSEDAGVAWKLLHAHDAAVYALEQIETTGRAFLAAYVDASVSDEEGLLAAVDAREWSAMWKRVDEAAETFGRALGDSADSVASGTASDGGYACDMCGKPGDGHKPDCPWGRTS